MLFFFLIKITGCKLDDIDVKGVISIRRRKRLYKCCFYKGSLGFKYGVTYSFSTIGEATRGNSSS